MRPSLVRSLVLLFALPIFLRAPLFLGFLLADPFYRFAGVGSVAPGLLAGMPTIDPNVGFVDQALTTRALDTLLSGHLPWWNPFEGLGAPLAGEMQNSAFFPLAFLIKLPNGSLFMAVVLAIAAGAGMLLLLRKLDVHPLAALTGAIVYQTCGTFSWLAGSWSYAIPWLPFLILGIEYCRSNTSLESRRGMVTVAVATALLIYSGFIEIAYFEGLVGVAWTLCRLVSRDGLPKAAFIGRAAVGGIAGIAIGAPILVAFADTLAMSHVAPIHDGKNVGPHLGWASLLQKFVPYAFGPIFASHQDAVGGTWGNTGGYVGFIALVLALCGVAGRKNLIPRIVCAIVCVFGFTAMFGGPLFWALVVFPGVKYTAYYRYVDVSVAFAVAVLAAICIEDFLTRSARSLRLPIAFAVGLLIVAFAWYAANPQLSGPQATLDSDLASWHTFSACVFIASCIAIVAALVVPNRTVGAVLLSVAVCTEAALFTIIPILSSPSSATVAVGGIRYLQTHLGLQRVYSIGPIGPDYGSFFGIADLDYADDPVPARTVDYVKSRLDEQTDGYNYLGSRERSGLTQTENFVARLAAFEAVGVKFFLTEPNAASPSPKMVPRYRDAAMSIYEVPHPKPYFSANGCTLAVASRTSLTAACSAPATLCRLELNAPGWTVGVGGHRSPPSDCGEIFQAVRLPAGTSSIEYAFEPPHMRIAEAVFAIASIAVLVMLWLCLPKKRSLAVAG